MPSIKEKTLTILRLELQPAVIAVRLKDKIAEKFYIQFVSIKFRVDTQIVLKYIPNTNRNFPIFVVNHLNETRLNSKVVDWYLIPENQNPADLRTRHMPFSILKDSTTWFYGPEQSNQFVKSGKSKVNIDDRGLEYDYLVNTVQTLTQNCQKITFR